MQGKEGVGNGDNRRIVSPRRSGSADKLGYAMACGQRAGEVERYYLAANTSNRLLFGSLTLSIIGEAS